MDKVETPRNGIESLYVCENTGSTSKLQDQSSLKIHNMSQENQISVIFMSMEILMNALKLYSFVLDLIPLL